MASGPSAAEADLALCRRPGVRVLTVNSSWRLAPWCDAVYASDLMWWERSGPPADFAGLRICRDPAAARLPGMRVMTGPTGAGAEGIVFEPRGTICCAGNSGQQALNVAVQFGARRIVLVGYDMTLTHGSHWHGRHPRGLGNPRAAGVERWRARLDRQAPRLAEAGIEVINASEVSALTAYRNAPLAVALSEWLDGGE